MPAPIARFPGNLSGTVQADQIFIGNQDTLLVQEGCNPTEFGYGDTRVVLEPRRWEPGVRARM